MISDERKEKENAKGWTYGSPDGACVAQVDAARAAADVGREVGSKPHPNENLC
jgi:hypothetical protein